MSHEALPAPPPVYSQNPVRSSSPRINLPQNDIINANATAFRQNHGSPSLSPLVTSPSMLGGYADNESPVQIYPPDSLYSSPQSNGQNYPAAPPRPSNTQDPTRLSPALQVPKRKPLDNRLNPSDMSSHRRIASENLTTSSHDLDSNTRAARHVSASFEPEQTENFEPLRYHHLGPHDAEMRTLDNRASKLTIQTVQSDGSAGSDPSKQDLNNVRLSTFGRNLARPDSGFSDVRGRTLSPHLSPNRPASRSSRSPDSRPLSYVDLLNVPYPQQAPSGAENLVNAGLRNVVGNNASLMSTRKTLEMYRANVKKTSDPAIQYEFAVFMVGAAQEEGLDEEIVSQGGKSEKSQTSVRDDLLKEAKHILQKLCDRSYPFAQYYLADGYASGLFNKGREDWDRAFPLFLQASKHGHAEAGYRTALCYEFGWGCRVDGMKAVQFYQHAASKNHPGAMLRLGRACLTGDMGLNKKYREGVRWLKRAAEAADYQYNQAPFDLGSLHETGFGPDVFKDESYAAQLFTKAADLGHAEANHRLGEAYEYGQLNCPRDPALSIHFYTGAAEQGHALSQMALCAWYMVGVENVLEKDESEAYEWAKRAAEQGLPKAQYTLGYFTEMGIGCRKDPLEANVWYVRAADQGEERAKHRIAAIRAAATGADPVKAAAAKKGKLTPSTTSGNVGPAGEKESWRIDWPY
jgi:TPR repeat protein